MSLYSELNSLETVREENLHPCTAVGHQLHPLDACGHHRQHAVTYTDAMSIQVLMITKCKLSSAGALDEMLRHSCRCCELVEDLQPNLLVGV